VGAIGGSGLKRTHSADFDVTSRHDACAHDVRDDDDDDDDPDVFARGERCGCHLPDVRARRRLPRGRASTRTRDGED